MSRYPAETRARAASRSPRAERAWARSLGRGRDYAQLLKPRVMSLVVFTALVGMVAAPGTLPPVLALAAMACIATGAGAAGALNMWYDADIDARMMRTRARPVPAGRIAPGEALGFGAVLAAGSVLFMGLAVNLAAAALLAVTIGFYLFVYTMWLKRRTWWNVVIGGAAGAFPPVIGWTAVTGAADPAAWVLFGIIFFWTPPHSWALALARAQDYAAAGVPMLPAIAGPAAAQRQIVAYTVLLIPVALLPWALGMAGAVYGAGAAVLNLLFLLGALDLWRRGGAPRAARLFGFSIFYLFLLFVLLLADHGSAAS